MKQQERLKGKRPLLDLHFLVNISASLSSWVKGDFVHEGREEASMVPGKDDSGKDGSRDEFKSKS